MEFGFVQVPPPLETPVQNEARALGLVDGLRVDNALGSYRCSNCGRMDKSGKLVWVPDSVKRVDSAEDIKELCRLSAYNGSGSGWCLSCAKKLGKTFLQRLFT